MIEFRTKGPQVPYRRGARLTDPARYRALVIAACVMRAEPVLTLRNQTLLMMDCASLVL